MGKWSSKHRRRLAQRAASVYIESWLRHYGRPRGPRSKRQSQRSVAAAYKVSQAVLSREFQEQMWKLRTDPELFQLRGSHPHSMKAMQRHAGAIMFLGM